MRRRSSPERPGVGLLALAAMAAALVLLLLTTVAGSQEQSQGPGREPVQGQTRSQSGGGGERRTEGAAGRGPELRAKGWVLIDARDGERLAGRAASRPLPVASATKLMTAYVALRRLRPEERLTAPAYDASPVESLLGLRRGESMTVRDLLYALILPSANDAAVTLALGVDTSVGGFVERMNRAASSLGLGDSSFANPIGLDDPANHSSAADLAKLARKLLGNRLFARIADTPRRVLRTGDRPRRIESRNNLLLSDASVNGVKTGHTLGAGYVLVASATRGSTTLISAVLGAPSEDARDAETRRLLRYGFSLYRPRSVIAKGEKLAVTGLDHRDGELALAAARQVKVTARKGEKVATQVNAPTEVSGEIERGDRVGTATVTIDGRTAEVVPLVATRNVAAATILDRVRSASPLGVPALPAALIVIVLLLLLGRTLRLPPRERKKPSEPARRTPEERRAMHEQRKRKREANGDPE